MRDTYDIWTNYITFCIACYQLPFMTLYNLQRELNKKKN